LRFQILDSRFTFLFRAHANRPRTGCAKGKKKKPPGHLNEKMENVFLCLVPWLATTELRHHSQQESHDEKEPPPRIQIEPARSLTRAHPRRPNMRTQNAFKQHHHHNLHSYITQAHRRSSSAHSSEEHRAALTDPPATRSITLDPPEPARTPPTSAKTKGGALLPPPPSAAETRRRTHPFSFPSPRGLSHTSSRRTRTSSKKSSAPPTSSADASRAPPPLLAPRGKLLATRSTGAAAAQAQPNLRSRTPPTPYPRPTHRPRTPRHATPTLNAPLPRATPPKTPPIALPCRSRIATTPPLTRRSRAYHAALSHAQEKPAHAKLLWPHHGDVEGSTVEIDPPRRSAASSKRDKCMCAYLCVSFMAPPTPSPTPAV